MPNQVTGKILIIGQVESFNGANGSFNKREVVLDTSRRKDQWSDEWFYNYPKFEFTGKYIDTPLNFQVGDIVTVSFDLQGRKVESGGQTRYFTNIVGYKMEPYRRQQAAPAQSAPEPAQAAPAAQPAPAEAPFPSQVDSEGNPVDPNKDDLPF